MWFQSISRRIDQLFTRGSAGSVHPELDSEPLFLSTQSVSQLNRLRLSASRFLPGKAAGLRPSLRRKPSYDFREHRMYVPGDDVRYVDWKASSRQEHIFIRQGEQPKEVSVYLLLDCSASMGWGSSPKSLAALQLTAALGFSALSHGDTLLIQPLDRGVNPLFGLASGKGQVPKLLKYLRSLRFSGRVDLARSLRNFSHQRVGGLTIIISDLLDSDVSSALAYLPSPTWDVVVLHLLHPQELNPELRGDFQMMDIETEKLANYDVDAKSLQMYKQQLDTWLDNMDMACLENNAFYTLVPTNWSLATEVIPHLHSIQVLTSL